MIRRTETRMEKVAGVILATVIGTLLAVAIAYGSTATRLLEAAQ